MAITTSVAPFYAGQKIFATVLCVVFGIWGAYDYWWKIPAQQKAFDEYQAFQSRVTQVEKEIASQGGRATREQAVELEQAKLGMLTISPNGSEPVRPSTFDRAVQWVYIACLPIAPIFLVMFLNARRQRYTLDDEGTLHFQGDKEHKSGAWKQEEIADIDMDRWMAKSIAYAVHADGRRLKLDAYLHKNLHLIVGALASRMHPDQWDAEARRVKNDSSDESGEPESPSESDDTVSEAAAT